MLVALDMMAVLDLWQVVGSLGLDGRLLVVLDLMAGCW